jgi:hypothetical protein
MPKTQDQRRALMNLSMREMLKPMVIFGIVALMLDSFSFAFTDVYGVGEGVHSVRG